ncbi:MAG: DUF2889 domain-containing protein [Candidatus Helarchaeota archaeon]
MMLQFCRTKFVGFEWISEDYLKIYGTLDDNLYSMQVDIKLKIPELIIESISGKMRRFTTPFCEDAINFLEKGKGIKIGSGFQSQVKRLIGRPGCRHFGNLINECCEAIIPGLVGMKLKEKREKNHLITLTEVLKELLEKYPQLGSYCSVLSEIVTR